MNKEKLLDYTRLNSSTLEELELNYIKIYKKITNCQITFDNWKSLRFHEVSNSHSCPLKGKTNWCNTYKNLPTSYLGWSVFITGFYDEKEYYNKKFIFYDEKLWLDKSFTQFDSLDYQRGFHHGTFNGGHIFSGDFLFFLDDFPLLKKNLLNIVSEKELNDIFPNEKDLLNFKRKCKIESFL